MPRKLSTSFLKILKSVKSKRPRTVIEHILKHGHVTTEELRDEHGYDHPPRAVRDVRELGIPLETFKVTGKSGRKIAAYRFADPSSVRGGTHAGRRSFPKAFKNTLVEQYGNKCGICFTTYEPTYLQIDHRVPYEVGGDLRGTLRVDDFMLICGSCNRAKSWSCEHCKNWSTHKSPETCRSCYWVSPADYTHVAMVDEKRLAIAWVGGEVADYNAMQERAQGEKMPEFVKKILRRHLRDTPESDHA